MSDKKSNAGRPTKYRKEFCKMLINHMSQGKSFESFGAKVEVGKNTMYEWCRSYPEFHDAKRIGTMKCLDKWEDIGNDGLYAKYFNDKVYRLNMMNRFGWGEKQTQNVEVEQKQKVEIDFSKTSINDLVDFIKKEVKSS